MAVGTTSKIDWVATCLGYRSLITTNRVTPGIISLFEKLNSRLFRGRFTLVQQAPSPLLEGRDTILVDDTMQSAIAKLQAGVMISPIQNFVHTPRLTPTPGIGATTSAQRCVGSFIFHDLLLSCQ